MTFYPVLYYSLQNIFYTSFSCPFLIILKVQLTANLIYFFHEMTQIKPGVVLPLNVYNAMQKHILTWVLWLIFLITCIIFLNLFIRSFGPFLIPCIQTHSAFFYTTNSTFTKAAYWRLSLSFYLLLNY